VILGSRAKPGEESVALGQAARADAGAGPARLLLLTVAVGTTLAPLNSTMIAVALPDIQGAFGVSVAATAWLVTLYLVAMAVGQPIGGRLGDLYGRRRIYLLGLAWFAIASAGCAFAGNLPMLIIFRTQQALAGALTFPNGAALIREGIPAERRGSAFGTIGMAASVAAASGPPIGGLLVHQFGWAAIFWANVPVVLMSILLGLRSLPHPDPESRPSARAGFDLAGSGLLAASLGTLILVPTTVRLDLPLLGVACGLIGVLIGGAFVAWELRTPAPVVDVRVFRRIEFAAACASVGLTNLVMYTTLLALPLYLEQVRGHDTRVTGLTLAAMSALAALAGPIGGRWADVRGRILPALSGGAAVCAGAGGLAVAVGFVPLWPVILALVVMGAGLGISGAPVQAAAVESVAAGKAGSASGVFSTSRYLGSVIGSTALAIVFATRPDSGQSGRFIGLFAVLALIAVGTIAVNAQLGHRT
jgi:EmrB/QacA subfamily drug resistance transporter